MHPLKKHCYTLALLPMLLLSCTDQKPDLEFNTKVDSPAFLANHPKVLFDEGHNNFHKSSSTYRPFVELIKNDGYAVQVNKKAFDPELLDRCDILVIANAKGKERKYEPAFTESECEAVHDWIEADGALLLIADHYPMGSAAKDLSEKFGVRMSEGFTEDSLHCDKSSTDKGQLVFDNVNGLLMDCPITRGRNADEGIHRIVTFTGQSLSAPDSNAIVLKLSPHAYDTAPDSIWQRKHLIFFTNTYTRFADPKPALGNCQAAALEIGAGRVVILGEAAMLTAQIVQGIKFGMNYPNNDNKQFALNILHWLSRII